MQVRIGNLFAVFSVAVLSASALNAQANVTAADYVRAQELSEKYSSVATGAPSLPVWIDANSLWYRKSVPGGHSFVLVDAANRDAVTQVPAFDHERLATALNSAHSTASPQATALALPFESFSFADGRSRVTVSAWNINWNCSLLDYTCSRSTEAPRPGLGGGFGGGGGGGFGGGVTEVRSPDGSSIAYIANYNVYVRGSQETHANGVALSTNGSEGNPFTIQSIVWSPDSRYIAANRVRPGYRRIVRYIESSPADQLQPKYFERVYTKPGDVLDLPQPALLDVVNRKQTDIDATLFPDPYSLSRAAWRRDSRGFTFEYNERGHQRYRIVEVSAGTGSARALVDESTSTFIDYRRASVGLQNGGGTYRYDVNDGAEIIWLSERDGWSHLYLYDGHSGSLRNQITKGEWVVRAVHRIDEARREIVFSAGGMNADQDPYFAHYYRVGFDGTGLRALTDAPADHQIALSPNAELYVDYWSRVDMAPVAVLRQMSDGKVLTELARGDLAELRKTGWRPPEVFVSKGRDGQTDIWGVVVKPVNFDPRKKYPVIEYIYAGPHGSFVPKSFAPWYNMQSIAELGFIVVQIDGMGTANRSKAFHDVAWQNLGDAGFPDRKLWHKAYAAGNSWYDISRVGIFGGSAGGQNAMGALLFHPDFYKVAVSFAGCHDNRMDKIWWNEQWMGYPIGEHYEASSNMVNAHKLQGELLLVVPELDTNVDPSSTMQVVNALIKANKSFDMLVMPGEEHGGGRRGDSAPYGDRKMWDFFVQHLHGTVPPKWNSMNLGVSPVRSVGAVPSTEAMFGAGWESLAASWFETP